MSFVDLMNRRLNTRVPDRLGPLSLSRNLYIQRTKGPTCTIRLETVVHLSDPLMIHGPDVSVCDNRFLGLRLYLLKVLRYW